MCLERDIVNNPLRYATKEITCYKVIMVPYELRGKFKTKLLRLFGKFKHYETYFQDAPITIGTTAHAVPAYTKAELKSIERTESSLGAGFIHSFKHKKDAINFVRIHINRNIALVKCIIPVGAYYFEGSDEWSDKEQYASTALKYVKVIIH